MSPHHCQVCGRRKPLRADGTIGMHYVDGVPCPGVGAVPIAQGTDALKAAAVAAWLTERGLTLARQAHDDRHARLRLNVPLDWRRLLPESEAGIRARKLDRRLRRVLGREAFLAWDLTRFLAYRCGTKL